MPLGLPGRHSNRSQQALDNSLAQAQAQAQAQRGPANNQPLPASIVPGDEDKPYELRSPQPPSYASPRDELHNYVPPNSAQGGDSQQYQDSVDRPSRSQSHRLTVGYPPIQPPSSLPELRGASVDDQVLADYGRPYNTVVEHRLPPLPVEQKKSKARGFFSSFHSSKSTRTAEAAPSLEPASSHNNLGGISRKISIRHKGTSPVLPSAGNNASGEKQHQIPGWQSSQSSELQLPSPHEADEDESAAGQYIIHQPGQDVDRLPGTNQEQLLNPTIRLAGGEQEPTVRLVDEGWQKQYQLPPQLLTQEQWIAQQSQHSPVPISPISQLQQQQTEYSQTNSQLGQYQNFHSSSQQIPTHTQVRSPTNPEVISQLSHESPTEQGEEPRPVSGQSNNQHQVLGGNYAGQQLQSEYPPRVTSVQGPRPPGQQSAMAPPPVQSSQNRRSADIKQTLQQDGRNSGPPPSYSQQQYAPREQATVQGAANPPTSAPGAQQSAAYRNSSLQREYSGQAEGRNTPPLPNERDRELTEMDKLVIKYKKVKGLYFEKLGQVEQLQNTLANQRLSQSRTSLDDSEYATRFNRLDGAIKEIAFSIRKDWKTIPRWLAPYVNQDAQKVGTKEMTAVGRAAISRWIAEEIFFKCFHPGLDLGLSSELKRIEQNIRLFASPLTSQEESDMLTSKVVQWKLSTVEGLGYALNSTQTHEAKAMFTHMAVTNLTAHLLSHLQDPAPQGIEGNATSIIELAVGIACHLPLESREISVSYPLPGDTVQPNFKIEAALPPLDNVAADASGDAEASSEARDHSSEGDSGKAEPGNQKLIKKQQDKNKALPQLVSQNSINGRKLSTSTAGASEPGQDKGKDRGDGTQKIRYAGFMGVEVRGRQWLINPPVWTIS